MLPYSSGVASLNLMPGHTFSLNSYSHTGYNYYHASLYSHIYSFIRAFINICCFEKVHSTTKPMHDLFYALYGLYRKAYMAYLLPKRSINNLLHLSAHGT